MASIISAGTTSGTSLNLSGDTSGVLQLASNGSTTAVTIDTSQNVGIGTSSPATKLSLNVAGATDLYTRYTNGSFTSGFYVGLATGTSALLAVNDNLPMSFNTNNTERMRITAAGNVGIGTTSPSATLDVGSSISRSGAAQNNIYADYRITAATTGVVSSLASRIVGIGGSTYTIPDAAVYKADPTVAQTGVTITNAYGLYIGNMADPTSGGSVTNSWGVYQTASSNQNYFAGNLLVGATSAATPTGVTSKFVSQGAFTGTNFGAAISSTAATGVDHYYISFQTATTTQRGYIYYNNGAGQVQLSATSDIRLKENIVDAPLALPILEQVKVRQYDWKETGNTNVGFVAQELYDVIPRAVAVGEDNEDGSIKRVWGVDNGTLVPYLVKAIQELKAELDATKAEVQALKGVA